MHKDQEYDKYEFQEFLEEPPNSPHHKSYDYGYGDKEFKLNIDPEKIDSIIESLRSNPCGEIMLDRTVPEIDIEPQDCPDCKGSGQYTGLNNTENCRACAGTGGHIPL